MISLFLSSKELCLKPGIHKTKVTIHIAGYICICWERFRVIELLRTNRLHTIYICAAVGMDYCEAVEKLTTPESKILDETTVEENYDTLSK